MTELMTALCVWNAIVFFIYGLDKSKARRGKWRISENTLITLAFAFGGVGALLGMLILRHKTRHKKFIFFVPLAVVVNICLIYFIAKNLL